MADTVATTVRLTPDVRRWLKRQSAETDTPMSALIERAVRQAMPSVPQPRYTGE